MNDKAFAKQPLPYFEFENLRIFSVFLLFNVHCQCSVFNVMHTNNSRWASCQCNFLPFSSRKKVLFSNGCGIVDPLFPELVFLHSFQPEKYLLRVPE